MRLAPHGLDYENSDVGCSYFRDCRRIDLLDSSVPWRSSKEEELNAIFNPIHRNRKRICSDVDLRYIERHWVVRNFISLSYRLTWNQRKVTP